MTELEDCLLALGQGDSQALAKIYQHYSRPLLAMLWRLAGERNLAEEWLHEGFERLWQRAGEYQPGQGRAEAWLWALFRHHGLDQLRTRKRRLRLLQRWQTEAEEEASPATTRLPHQPLAQCLAQLPGETRQALVLSYSYGLSHDELQQQLGVPLGTLKSWIRRGAERLKTCLYQLGITSLN
ncbi:RNA polymerase sigma factor [Balneatrix alpica]|uniref:RNA polymerase sigma factor n=1 Tax=Balneatrix alpica TaxID=75684 RepID=A0ABV5Z871_9GAMM|nr:sigma-70 family RNA polymerase sigma factor [Balneatrix alpica]